MNTSGIASAVSTATEAGPSERTRARDLILMNVRCPIRVGSGMTKHQLVAVVCLVTLVGGCVVSETASPFRNASPYNQTSTPLARGQQTSVQPPRRQSSGTQLVLPAFGGPPVLGIPVGGAVYLPVSGGRPITGIPVSP
jgi:hypothetical protein